MNHIAKQIHAKITQAKKILLIPHTNPDGDALGSASALTHYLESIGKPHSIWCATPAGEEFGYLFGIKKITSDASVWKENSHDLVIVLDTGDITRAGMAEHLANLSERPALINIDHHSTNEQFGDINLVNASASSTAEVLYAFFRANKIAISRSIATSLMTGIMTDTDNFTNAAAGENSLAIAGELIRAGADRSIIRSRLFGHKSVAALTLWGRALARLTELGETRIIGTEITLRDIKECRATESDADGIANFLNLADPMNGRAMLVLKELADGRWRGSLRTTRSDVDVSAIALALGGGGHKKAAGFTIEATSADEVKQKILSVMRDTKIHDK